MESYLNFAFMAEIPIEGTSNYNAALHMLRDNYVQNFLCNLFDIPCPEYIYRKFSYFWVTGRQAKGSFY